MAPETHTRYRVQRLIRLGEWLERNEAALQLAIDTIDQAHDVLIDGPDDELALSDVVEMTAFKMLNAVQTLNQIRSDLAFDVPTKDVRRGRDVTLHHPYASDEAKRYEVVIKAPVPALQQDAIPLYQAAAKAAQEKKDA